ncbi:MAG: metallophosphoesterase family protein [Chloroflexi bacterium]|nr:metallophosphoesterase family protein [Chloroflexota bacterium]
MKIIALPDIHKTGVTWLSFFADDLAAADLVLLVGDITNGRRDGQTVLDARRRYTPRLRAVPGNWDSNAVEDSLAAQHLSLHGRCENINGLAFVGVGGALAPTAGGPRTYSEALLDAYLRLTLP